MKGELVSTFNCLKLWKCFCTSLFSPIYVAFFGRAEERNMYLPKLISVNVVINNRKFSCLSYIYLIVRFYNWLELIVKNSNIIVCVKMKNKKKRHA